MLAGLCVLGGTTQRAAVWNETAAILVIDAGHGGRDGGAVASDGTLESNVNLDIALKLQTLCDFCGISYRMIRTDDTSFTQGDTYSERAELEERAQIVNGYLQPFYLSIHQNCFPSHLAHGAVVLYRNDPVSKLWGSNTQFMIREFLQKDNRHVAEERANGIYVFTHIDRPGILVECGFLSNPSDLAALQSEGYQKSLAAVLLAAFLTTYSS